MLPAQPVAITSQNQIHHQVKQQVTENLNQMGYKVTSNDVISYSQETPVTKTPELHQVGADIIDADDLAYLMKNAVKMEDTKRTTKSNNPLRILLNKLSRKG